MTKKPVTKKASTTKKATGPKTQVNIRGNITAKRDVIFGDQYNDFRQQVAQIASPQEFIGKLQELHGKITQIKQQPDVLPEDKEMLELAEGQVGEAIAEAKQPTPAAEPIITKLKSTKKIMDSLGESVKSAVGLGSAIAGFLGIVLKLFGG